MASISLRAYNREIENMIDHGQAEDAVAHCMHILHSIPKYIHAYRLLGKALLELRRYGDAADIFNRVLSAIPDDFVANIGMSIIRENEKNLDLAIWHMERAFENQPANGVVQGELRRLYGRRDGLEPTKTRMTRGALARMYAKGHLYRQAIGELRAALGEDPQRIDLQILLADMYHKSGQNVEAINACNLVLRKLPYCVEASRILAMILPKTERKEDAQTYYQRLVAMDPYLGKVTDGSFDAESAPDDAIQLEKLSSQARQNLLQSSSQPDWASSLGMAFEAPSNSQALPDWLTGENKSLANIPQLQEEAEPALEDLETVQLPDWLTPEPAKTEQVQPAEPSTELPDQDENAIPDFLKNLGWEPSKDSSESSAPVFTEDSEEAEKGKVPDWLQTMVDEETKAPASGETPPWLNEKQPGESDTIVNWLGTKPVQSSPDDLKSLEEALKQVSPAASTPAEPAAEIDLPDWLSQTPSAGTVTQAHNDMDDITLVGGTALTSAALSSAQLGNALPAEDVPDWLKGLGMAEVDSTEASDPTAWAFEAAPPAANTSAAETLISQPAASAEPADDLADWLKGLDDKQEDTQPTGQKTAAWDFGLSQPAANDALQPAAEALPAEDVPDWLKGLGMDDAAPAAAADDSTWTLETSQSGARDFASETLIAPPVNAAQPDVEPANDLADWLKGLDDKAEDTQPAAVETPAWDLGLSQPGANDTLQPAAEAIPAEDIPDWLKGLGMDDAAPAAAVETPAWDFEEAPAAANEAVSETLFAQPAPPEAQAEAIPGAALPADDIPDWLKGLGMDDGAPTAAVETPAWGFEEAPVAANEAVSETLFAQPAAPEAQADALLGAALPAEDIPDWLKGLGMDDAAPAAAVEQPIWAFEDSQPAGETLIAQPLDAVPTNAQPTSSLSDWLKDLEDKDEDTQPAGVETPAWELEQGHPAINEAAASPVLDVLQPGEALPVEALAGEALPAEDIPDWLKGLGMDEAAEAPAAAVEALEPPAWEFEQPQPVANDVAEAVGSQTLGGALGAEEIPDWLKAMERTEEDTKPTILKKAEPQTAAPAAVETAPAASGFNLEDPDAAMAWLESLAANQGVAQDQLTTRPEDRPETPTWLVEAGTQANERGELSTYVPGETTQPQPTAVEPVSLAAPEVASPETLTPELPVWDFTDLHPASLEIATISAQTVQTPGEATVSDEMPDWLKELEAEAASMPPASVPPVVEIVQPEASQPLAAEPAAAAVETAPASAGFNLDDPDAAMAWLESLAASQGVDQDQLTTRPEDRPETPTWLVEAGAQANERGELSTYVPGETTQPLTPEQTATATQVAQQVSAETEPVAVNAPVVEQQDLPSPEETSAVEIPAVETPVFETPVTAETAPAAADFNLDDPDAAMAWLESLAASQGVTQDQLTTRPEDRPETPSWLVEAGAQANERGELSTYVPGETTLPLTPEQAAAAQPVPAETDPVAVSASAEEVPAWLQGMDVPPPSAEDTKPNLAQKEPVQEILAPETPDEPVEDLPEWLKEQEKPAQSDISTWLEEQPAPVTPDATPEPAAEAETDELPEWLKSFAAPAAKLDLNKATLRELENLPGMGFVMAQTIIAQREVNGDFQSVDELANVFDMDPVLLSVLKDHLEVKEVQPAAAAVIQTTEPAQPQAQPDATPAAETSVVPAWEPSTADLQHAAQQISAGESESAAATLNALIQRQDQLPEIIQTLQTALKKQPRDVYLLQSLGDAYLHSDRLQEALDTYIAAEKAL